MVRGTAIICDSCERTTTYVIHDVFDPPTSRTDAVRRIGQQNGGFAFRNGRDLCAGCTALEPPEG